MWNCDGTAGETGSGCCYINQHSIISRRIRRIAECDVADYPLFQFEFAEGVVDAIGELKSNDVENKATGAPLFGEFCVKKKAIEKKLSQEIHMPN